MNIHHSIVDRHCSVFSLVRFFSADDIWHELHITGWMDGRGPRRRRRHMMNESSHTLRIDWERTSRDSRPPYAMYINGVTPR